MSVDFDRSRVTLVDHPLVQHKLTIMRDENTGSKQFRELVKELALFEGYEATRDFPLEDAPVTTPICETTGKRIAGRKVAIVPILRAGLGMVDGLLELIPAARVGHVGMYRDEVTHEPHEYYAKLPSDADQRICLVVDPMLGNRRHRLPARAGREGHSLACPGRCSRGNCDRSRTRSRCPLVYLLH